METAKLLMKLGTFSIKCILFTYPPANKNKALTKQLGWYPLFEGLQCLLRYFSLLSISTAVRNFQRWKVSGSPLSGNGECTGHRELSLVLKQRSSNKADRRDQSQSEQAMSTLGELGTRARPCTLEKLLQPLGIKSWEEVQEKGLSRDSVQGWHQQTNQVFMIQISSKINRIAESWAA